MKRQLRIQHSQRNDSTQQVVSRWRLQIAFPEWVNGTWQIPVRHKLYHASGMPVSNLKARICPIGKIWDRAVFPRDRSLAGSVKRLGKTSRGLRQLGDTCHVHAGLIARMCKHNRS